MHFYLLVAHIFFFVCIEIDQDVEDLASIGVTCLQQLVVLAGDTFDDSVWEKIVGQFSKLIELTMPCELFTARRCMLATSPGTAVPTHMRPSPYAGYLGPLSLSPLQRAGCKLGETLFTSFGVGELAKRVSGAQRIGGAAPVSVIALRSGARAYLQTNDVLRNVFTMREREHIAAASSRGGAPRAAAAGRRRASDASSTSLPFDRTAVCVFAFAVNSAPVRSHRWTAAAGQPPLDRRARSLTRAPPPRLRSLRPPPPASASPCVDAPTALRAAAFSSSFSTP